MLNYRTKMIFIFVCCLFASSVSIFRLNEERRVRRLMDCEYFHCITDNPMVRTLWAAETGNIDILSEMIAKDASLVNALDEDGYTPLHRAAYEGHVQTAEVSHISVVGGVLGLGWCGMSLLSGECWIQVAICWLNQWVGNTVKLLADEGEAWVIRVNRALVGRTRLVWRCHSCIG